ncbi:MAG: cytidylate kinase-like family protein [Dictyoglomus sp.]|nr:cytidylate kinase-like family protein [Dictyoglomus sp.]MCX7942423.1 cytidylate kinase-like family protein [Dictyoglomaceae bacterium]MDW8187686.1 cytidylate kinase-like family protein [Dictyoglomus sp.]
MAIITISRQYGSNGEKIAEKLARDLNYRYFDKFLMTEIAISSGLSEAEVIDFNEDNYKVKGFFEQLFRRREFVGEITVKEKDNVTGITSIITKTFDEESGLRFVQAVIKKLKDWGDVVILGRGAQVLLKDNPKTLHIRIIAPLEYRVKNVMKERNLTREESLRLIIEKDKSAEEYLKRFYNVDWNNPELYHLILNTGLLSWEQGVEVIKNALRAII